MLALNQIIIYLAIIHKGEWDEIHKAVDVHTLAGEEEMATAIQNMKCKAVTIIDKEYPEKLKHVYKPPYVLFYYGDLSLLYKDNIIGVVGSREASTYSLDYGRKMLEPLSEKQPVIISGLAHGIDTMAHETALKTGMPTIAVLGTGIDYCYPRDNYPLYEEIKKKGLIISEHPGKEFVDKSNFAERNRLIAGLADFLFVPEVKNHSGTMVTVNFTLSQGKDVLALPHPLGDGTVNDELIRDGAKIVSEPDDIADNLKIY